jgi:hypothetical protein
MRHLIIPDCQIRAEDDLLFLQWIGKYIVDKKPEKVICLGDFGDMPSLSSYDVGKKSFEGRRYMKDTNAVIDAQKVLFGPIDAYNIKQRSTKHAIYKPEYHMILGNHEERINRAVNNDAKLEGMLSIDDLCYSIFGWKVHPFLEVAVIDGVAYSHYFVSGVAGRPCSTAQQQLTKKHMSCISGHQQGLQIATGNRADGKMIHSIIAGSCYQHNEDYLGPQANNHWRGILVLNDVHDGEFEAMPVTLKYLEKRYG